MVLCVPVMMLQIFLPPTPQGYVCEFVSTSRRYTHTVALTVTKMRYVLMKKPGPV